jgi:hypothetical protein
MTDKKEAIEKTLNYICGGLETMQPGESLTITRVEYAFDVPYHSAGLSDDVRRFAFDPPTTPIPPDMTAVWVRDFYARPWSGPYLSTGKTRHAEGFPWLRTYHGENNWQEWKYWTTADPRKEKP